jgi:hypothetical protein
MSAEPHNPPAPTLDYPDAVVAGARAMHHAFGIGPWDKLTSSRQDFYCNAFAEGLKAMWNNDMDAAPYDDKVTLATSGGWVGDACRLEREDDDCGDMWVWADTRSTVTHRLIAWQHLPVHPGDAFLEWLFPPRPSPVPRTTGDAA